MGLAITGLALSEIRAVAWDCPDPAGIDGLLIGSANAILHGGPNLTRLTAVHQKQRWLVIGNIRVH